MFGDDIERMCELAEMHSQMGAFHRLEFTIIIIMTQFRLAVRRWVMSDQASCQAVVVLALLLAIGVGGGVYLVAALTRSLPLTILAGAVLLVMAFFAGSWVYFRLIEKPPK